jgi:hypothetical protein
MIWTASFQDPAVYNSYGWSGLITLGNHQAYSLD